MQLDNAMEENLFLKNKIKVEFNLFSELYFFIILKE